jgi:CobQ-like glutamine amidotransferase family enzyme
MKIKILYFYPEILNLYGDRGNIEIFCKRCEERSIYIELKEVGLGQKLSLEDLKEANFVFMGGGSDLNQKELFQDLLINKKGFLSDYILSGGCGLFICGAYQLLGNYYQTEDGKKIDGLGVLDFFTVNEGKEKRSVGKIKTLLNLKIKNSIFEKKDDRYLFGFENHGGQTYLGSSLEALGEVVYGFGNNKKSKKEGVHFLKTFGTYLHGPILSLNPKFCDYLIRLSLSNSELPLTLIDDSLIQKARFYLE